MKTKLKIWVMWLILLALVGCGMQSDATPSLDSATAPATVTVAIASSEISLSATSSTSHPTQIPTLTPISTLPPADAREIFTGLIKEGDECNLPCWLGITPGQTQLDEVENIFLQYSAIAFTEFTPKDAYLRVFFPSFEAVVHDAVTEVFSTSNGGISLIIVDAGMNPDENGVYNYGEPSYQEMWHRHFLPELFKAYDVPEKIFLDTTLLTVDSATGYPYALWVIYPQKGFLLRYGGVNFKDRENIKICPMQSSIQIIMWDIETSDYEEFIKNDEAGGISLGPQPVESVTDFDVESFFEFFKEGTLDTCFTTPASYWPPN